MVGIAYDSIIPVALTLIKRKKLNLWYLSAGLFFLFVSLLSLSQEPGFHNFSPGAQSSERWGFPVHNRLLFAVIFIFGVLSIITAFLKSSGTGIDKAKNTYNKICISCGAIQKSQDAKELSCYKCGGKVENISGVIKRHPELIKSIKKNL
ncbi:MAG: hypothetical protein ABIK92_21445 [Pseudomonadota bacterium]